MGHHQHGHGHHHHHHAPNKKNRMMLLFSFILTISFAALEVAYGFFTHSLALLSEGFHMSSDGISLLLGYLAVFFGAKASSKARTFGYKRFEPIAAFLNGLALILIPLYVIVTAILRFFHPHKILTKEMLIVACIGLVMNLIVAFLLSRGEGDNLNMRAAALHVLADLFSSCVTILSALAIMYLDWRFVDPIASIVVSIVILLGGYHVTKDSLHVLLEGTPLDQSYDEIHDFLLSKGFVKEIIDLHFWSINGHDAFLMAKIAVFRTEYDESFLIELSHDLREKGIESTIQISFFPPYKK